MKRPLPVVVGALIAMAFAIDSAQAEERGSPRGGFDLARNLCSGCHAVRPGEILSPNRTAPSFETIAGVPGMTATALRVALRTSHRTMPNLILSEDDLNDVIAYILSLNGGS